MKKLFIGALASLALVSAPVSAEGYATLNVVGNNNAIVGETTEIKIVVDNIRGTYEDKGLAAIGGYLVFDKEYLEVVSVEKAQEPYQFLMNENIYKFAGLDLTLNNGIKEKTAIYTVTFKTLKEGNTNITLKDIELVDTKTEAEATINGLNLTIKTLEKEEITKPVVKTTTTTKVSKTITTVKTTQNVEITTKSALETTNVATKEKTKKESKITKIFSAIINFFKNIFKK